MRRAAVAALTASLLVVGACGVPTRDAADRADPNDVPFGLLDDRPSSTDTTRRPGVAVDVYYYDTATSRLVRVARDTDDTSLGGVLRQLQDVQSGSGLPVGNPLEDVDVVLSAEVSRGRATIDLGEAFGSLGGTAQLVALAELVYTATGRPGVGQVTFTRDGQPLEVPRGNGSLTSEPLTRSDYPDVAPLE